MNKYNMFSNSKNNRLKNRYFNIDQNNRNYDFSHNRVCSPLPLLYVPVLYVPLLYIETLCANMFSLQIS